VNETSTLVESITFLRNIDHFQNFMDEVRAMREASVRELRGKAPHELAEIAGTIAAYTEILDIAEGN